MTKKDFHKNCPKCGKELFYSRLDVLQLSLKNNNLCRSCCQIGKVVSDKTKEKLRILNTGYKRPQWVKDKISNSIRGKKKSKEHIEKVKRSLMGRIPTLEERIKNSIANKGRLCPMKGKHHTEETKYKLRLATINDLKEKGVLLGMPGARNYNIKACKYMDALNKKYGWNLQHALNGGEIELYGYFVDGYDKERNIIFEYDEKNHNETFRKNKDLVRQKNLLENINPSLFLRYDEQWNRLYKANNNELYENTKYL